MTKKYVLELTDDQLDHLAFAVLCQHDELEESEEANESEVVEAMDCLRQVQVNLHALRGA
ncbi:MAG: hypothetical protein GJU76_01620, partial [Gallionella sp.]|nr:hypothetical protein [Gallionella sp.]